MSDYHGNHGDTHLEHGARFVFIDRDRDQVSILEAGVAYWRDDVDGDVWYSQQDTRSFRDLWGNDTADSTCDTEGVLRNRGIDPSVLHLAWPQAREELPEKMLLDVLVTRAIGLMAYHGFGGQETYHDSRDELERFLTAKGVPSDEVR